MIGVENMAVRKMTTKWKNKVKKKSHKRCVKCGCKDNLTLHHIIPLKNGGTNKYSNIMVLCVECHRKIHEYKGGIE
jgi:5-methylcytosine-specific restriction endonuclease McrA